MCTCPCGFFRFLLSLFAKISLLSPRESGTSSRSIRHTGGVGSGESILVAVVLVGSAFSAILSENKINNGNAHASRYI